MRLWSGSVARCLVIRTAVTILPGISVAVRLRLIYMLEHDRCGGNHSLFEGGEFGVYAMARWSPSRRATAGAPFFHIEGEAGLPIFIRCHSRFRISRIGLVHSLPPHIHKGSRS